MVIFLFISLTLYSLNFVTWLCTDYDLLQGIKQGWYDGGSILFAVMLVIGFTGIMKFLVKKVGFLMD